MPVLQVGHNRRYSSHALKIKSWLVDRQQPLVMQYRVNTGFVPANHWVHRDAERRSRIVGELSHFVDFMQFITDEQPRRIFVKRIAGDENATMSNDNIIVTIKFNCGSIATLTYTASGNRALPRESVELFCEGKAIYNIPSDKRIMLFAGILGPSQQLAWLIDVAAMYINSDLFFLIVGDGSEKKTLQEKAKALPNVMFQHFVLCDEYPDLLAVSDLGIISLSSKNKTPVVPGKLLGYMAAKLPVFAVLNWQSDVHALMSEAGCGFSVNADDLTPVLSAFQQAYEQISTWLQRGEYGYRYAEAHFSKEKTMTILENLMGVSC